MDQEQIRYYMRQAYGYAAENSHDDSTHVGAVILIPNGLDLYGVNHFTSPQQFCPENLIRRRKYLRIVHAERDVIYKAACEGIRLAGRTMVCPWATCAECAQAIVLSGLSCVIAHKEAQDQTPDRWKKIIKIGHEILKDGGVQFIEWSGKVGDCQNLFDSRVWKP